MSNPPAGGPQPFGQPQQQQFGQQPQFGQPQDAPFGQAQFPPPAPHDYGQPPKRRNTRLIIRLSILGVVVIAGIIIAIYSFHTNPGGAQVGECLSGDVNDANSVKKTDCTAGDAVYMVVGRMENKTQTDFNNEDCHQYPTADAAFWEGQSNSTGAILCLQSIKGGGSGSTNSSGGSSPSSN